jgi:hypothetical protein
MSFFNPNVPWQVLTATDWTAPVESGTPPSGQGVIFQLPQLGAIMRLSIGVTPASTSLASGQPSTGYMDHAREVYGRTS